MALNFLGLGFTFGAKDVGLDSVLGRINEQFDQISASLTALQESSAERMSPAEDIAQSLTDQLQDVQDAAQGGLGLTEALDAPVGGGAAEAAVTGVGDALGDAASKATGMGTSFGRTANSLIGGAGKITGALGWVGMAIGPVISAFGAATDAVGNMIDAAAGMPARVSSRISSLADVSSTLSHSLEDEAVTLGQSARAAGANMGYTGRNLQRFIGQATGMAMGLNIGAEEAARAIRAMEEGGSALAATGLENARDVARFTAALGVNADILRNSTLQLQNLGASDEEIHRVVSAITLMGQETGDVSAALEELPQIMEGLRARRALGETPAQMAAFAADTAAASRALFGFVEDSDLARQMSQTLAQSLTQGTREFQQMFSGVQDQLPQLLTELSIVGGDVDEAFATMSQGPGQFLESIGTMVQQVRGDEQRMGRFMQFMRDRLGQTFGDEQIDAMVNFWTTMDDASIEAMNNVRAASVDLGQLGAEAHTTGRTLADVFDRLRGGFQVAFRRLGRRRVQEFVRETGERLRELRGTMQLLSREEGPMRDVMETMSMAGQIGALALLPTEMQASAIAADELQGSVMPLIQSFSSFSGIVETVGSFIALFATDVMVARRSTDNWSQAIDQVADRWANMIVDGIDNAETFLTNLINNFANFNWDSLFGGDGERDGIAGAFHRIIQRLGEVDWSGLWSNLQIGFGRLFKRVEPWFQEKWNQVKGIAREALSELWDEIDWGAVLEGLGDLGRAFWEAIRPALMNMVADMGDWLREHWHEIFLGALAVVTIALVAAVAGLAVAVVGAFFAPLAFAVTSFLAWATAAWDAWGEGISTFFSNLWDTITANFNQGVQDIQMVLGTISAFFTELWTTITTNFDQGIEDWRTTWETLGTFFTNTFTSLLQLVQPVVGAFTRIADVGRAALRGILGEAEEDFGNSINTVVGEDMAATEQVMTETAERISEVMEAVLHDATVSAIVEGFSTGFAEVVDNMAVFTEEMTDHFRTLGEGITDITSELFGTINDQAVDALIAMELAVEGIIARLRAITQANVRLAQARAEATEATLTTPADEAAVQARLERLRGNEVLLAINNPLWWSGPGQYQETFNRRMTELINAVESIGVRSTGEGMEERVRRIRALRPTPPGEGRGGQARVSGRETR
jgi:hypothetical protein